MHKDKANNNKKTHNMITKFKKKSFVTKQNLGCTLR